jgi:hypothetical protein
MKAFKSWRSYSNFASSIKHSNRYFYPDDVKDFLDTLLETSKSRIETLPKGAAYWRSQRGHGWRLENEEVGEVPAPYPPERMSPLPSRAKEGRANPKGISYLYLATTEKTAVAEARPWVGSRLSVGQFNLQKDQRIVNCTSDKEGTTFYFSEPSPRKREEAVWKNIDLAFSRPVTLSDDSVDYVPTQIIAEFFRDNGLDGLGYRSSLGDGYNIVLFEIDAAEIFNCYLYKIDRINFEYSDDANPYFL